MMFGVAVALNACAVLQLNPMWLSLGSGLGNKHKVKLFELSRRRTSKNVLRRTACAPLKERFLASSSNVLTRWFRPTQFLPPRSGQL